MPIIVEIKRVVDTDRLISCLRSAKKELREEGNNEDDTYFDEAIDCIVALEKMVNGFGKVATATPTQPFRFGDRVRIKKKDSIGEISETYPAYFKIATRSLAGNVEILTCSENEIEHLGIE